MTERSLERPRAADGPQTARPGVRAIAAVASLAVFALACGEPGDPAAGGVEYGLGDKADSAGCDPAADLCWHESDVVVMRSLMRLEQEAALGRRNPGASLADAVAALDSLGHKLTEPELDALEEIREQLAAGPAPDAADRLYERLRGEVLRRLTATYYATYMVAVGRAADSELDGKRDDGDAEPDPSVPGTYSEGMVESLRELRASGVSGKAYAALLELSGVLECEYQTIDASNFSPPVGYSREARIAAIVATYRLAAAASGVVSGAISAIPIAGIPLSVPLEAYAVFVIHTRMTFEIAAVNGWDIRENANLFVVTMFLFSDGELADIGHELAASPALDAVIRTVAYRLGIPVSTTLSVKIGASLIYYLTRFMARMGEKAVAEAGAASVGTAALESVLGWASMGLTILGSGAVDYYVTDKIGEHVAVVSRRWVVDLPLEGSSYLDREEARDCYFAELARMMRADGQVAELEARLFQAILAKPVYLGGGTWAYLTSAERRRHAALLASEAAQAPSEECIEDWFAGQEVGDKLALLSHFTAAKEIDGQGTEPENQRYTRLREALDGDGWFDGPSIGSYHLDYVERAAYLAVHPSEAEVAPAYDDVVSALGPIDTLRFLAEIPADVASDFSCGYLGECD